MFLKKALLAVDNRFFSVYILKICQVLLRIAIFDKIRKCLVINFFKRIGTT